MECRCVRLVTHARLLPHVTILTETARVVILHSRPLPHVTILLMGTTRVVIIYMYSAKISWGSFIMDRHRCSATFHVFNFADVCNYAKYMYKYAYFVDLYIMVN